MEKSGLTCWRLAFAFDQFEQGVVLGGVVLDVQALAGQFGEQVFDGLAFVEFDVPGAAGRAVLSVLLVGAGGFSSSPNSRGRGWPRRTSRRSSSVWK